MAPTILIGDCRETLKTLADNSVHCCVTSPPYWGLRDYRTGKWEGGDTECDHRGRSQTSTASTLNEWKNGGGQKYKEETGGMPFLGECGKCGAKRIDAQLGLEKTPEEYVANMVQVFREVRRVLREDGTLWLNLGDSYTTGGSTSARKSDPKASGDVSGGMRRIGTPDGLKPKDLVGIPWMTAFALRADGWYLRQWMPWVKRNAMPESVQDRPSTSCETFFLLTKTSSYFYDSEAVKMQGSSGPSDVKKMLEKKERIGGKHKDLVDPLSKASGATNIGQHRSVGDPSGRSRRNGDWFFDSDWQGMQTDEDGWPVAMVVNPQPYGEAHFATFPPKLVAPCILAGTSARGCCPKCAAPWERIVEDGEKDLEHQRACGGDSAGLYSGQSTKDYTSGGAQDASATKARILAGMRRRETVRWEPGCACFHLPGHAAPVPCTVIDPFGGSGTTGMVAIENGRQAILCELNPEYGDLIESRTNVTPGFNF